MSQSLSQIFIHIVFSTKERRPLLQEQIRDELYAYLGGTLRNLEAPALAIGGTEDHVHILCRLPRTLAVSDLLEEIKKTSSKWIKTKGDAFATFAWQGGYGAFSIGQSGVDAAMRYIRGQAEHHRKRSFQEEFLDLLRRYHVEWDERYVWG